MKYFLFSWTLFLCVAALSQQTYEKTTPIYFDAGKSTEYRRPEVRTFKYPQLIVVDSKGNVFVSRTVGYISGDKIIKITPDEKAVDFAGYIIKDSRNFTIQNKNTGSIKGMTIDANDNIFISSMDNAGAINKIMPDGSLERIAGAPYRDQGSKKGDFDVKDGKGEEARFWDVGNITVDRAGNLYVVDGGKYTWDKAEKKHGYIIRKITKDGDVTTLRSDTGILRFPYIRGLACDADNNLLISLSTMGCIKKLNITTSELSTLVGHCTNEKTSTPGKFKISSPAYISFSPTGDLVFSDSRMKRIVKINANKMTIVCGNNKTTHNNASPSYEGYKDGKALEAIFNEPMGIAYDKAGNLYIADTGNHCIRKMTPVGLVTTFFN